MVPKRKLLIELSQRFNLRDFVETGTGWDGRTIREVSSYFDRVYSINIDQHPIVKAWAANVGNVRLVVGSSGGILSTLLRDEHIVRALFWLDAHGNETFYRDDGQNQVPKELEAIAKCAPDSLVVVDDVDFVKDKLWVNSSYVFDPPPEWKVQHKGIGIAILHLGGYPEDL